MEAREKLTKFLEESSFYEAERILEDFPDNSKLILIACYCFVGTKTFVKETVN